MSLKKVRMLHKFMRNPLEILIMMMLQWSMIITRKMKHGQQLQKISNNNNKIKVRDNGTEFLGLIKVVHKENMMKIHKTMIMLFNSHNFKSLLCFACYVIHPSILSLTTFHVSLWLCFLFCLCLKQYYHILCLYLGTLD